jgi:hypothetical protein
MTTVSQPFSKSTKASLAIQPVVQTSAPYQRAGRNLPDCAVHRASAVFGEHYLAAVGACPADRPGPTHGEARFNSVQSL